MRSMTGYAKLSSETERFRINIEIKSVNNKNLALKIKLPYNLNFLENTIRIIISKYVSRGSVDLRLDLQDKDESLIDISYDKILAKRAYEVLDEIETDLKDKFDSKLDLLVRTFNIINRDDKELDEDIYKDYITQKLEEILPKFVETKQEEGERLRKYFIDQLEKIKKNLLEIKKLKNLVVEKYKTKLIENIKNLKNNIEISEEDILKEVLIYADRVDITEEISRLESHIEQLDIELQKNDISMGKKIEFILQEIFRELNTTGVKCNMYEISKLIVECKNELEKMKEQIMNIE